MNYWKGVFKTDPSNVRYTNNDGATTFSSFIWTASTKEEYDKHITIPALTSSNVNHNYFNAAETAIRKTLINYKESLFVLTKVNGYGNVLTLSDVNLVLYNNLIQYEKAEEKTTITRATTFYEAKINGDTDEEATAKAQAIKIDLSSLKAENGKKEFIAYLFAQHPALIRNYATYVNNLKYTTLLTEDEPEGSK